MQKDLEKNLADLRQRIKQTVEAHTQQLLVLLLPDHDNQPSELILSSGEINKEKVHRLERAIEARDSIERMIQEKLVELKREGMSLVAILDSGYEYRLQKAKSLVTPISEQKLAQGEGRPVKKVRIATSSS